MEAMSERERFENGNLPRDLEAEFVAALADAALRANALVESLPDPWRA